MAQRSTMRPPKGGNIKKGICENHQYLNPDTGETGDCPKCASGEIQSVNVQRLSDFRCSVCGTKLVPVKEKNKKPLIIAAVILVLALGGILLYWLNNRDTKPADEPIEEPPVTIVEEQTEGTDSLTVEEPQTEPEQIEEPTQEPDDAGAEPQAARTVLGGAAKLVKESGYTTIVFLRDYSLDLGKSDGRKLQIRKGESIERADIRHNVLRGGDYINLNKVEVNLSGLNVKL